MDTDNKVDGQADTPMEQEIAHDMIKQDNKENQITSKTKQIDTDRELGNTPTSGQESASAAPLDNDTKSTTATPRSDQQQEQQPDTRAHSKKTKFIDKLLELLESPACSDSICWDESGEVVIIRDIEKFTDAVLPRHFNHCNFNSFVRQLNMYGFKKKLSASMDSNYAEYKNSCFSKKDPERRHTIERTTTKNLKFAGSQLSKSKKEMMQTMEAFYQIGDDLNAVSEKQMDLVNISATLYERATDLERRNLLSLNQLTMEVERRSRLANMPMDSQSRLRSSNIPHIAESKAPILHSRTHCMQRRSSWEISRNEMPPTSCYSPTSTYYPPSARNVKRKSLDADEAQDYNKERTLRLSSLLATAPSSGATGTTTRNKVSSILNYSPPGQEEQHDSKYTFLPRQNHPWVDYQSQQSTPDRSHLSSSSCPSMHAPPPPFYPHTSFLPHTTTSSPSQHNPAIVDYQRPQMSYSGLESAAAPSFQDASGRREFMSGREREIYYEPRVDQHIPRPMPTDYSHIYRYSQQSCHRDDRSEPSVDETGNQSQSNLQ